MKKLIILKTRGDYIRGFRKHWKWLYKYPVIDGRLATKGDWPEWEFNGGRYPHQHYNCFLCRWGMDSSEEDCYFCPVVWPNFKKFDRSIFHCNNKGEIYYKWENTKTAKTRAKYAKMIAELPVRRIRK